MAEGNQVLLTLSNKPTMFIVHEAEEVENRANEPELFRPLTKHAIYKLLSNEFLLPAKDSRAVTRGYLSAVYRNEVFRVNRVDILTFEARLTTEDLVRTSFSCLLTSIDRLSRLLELQNHRGLGFRGSSLPDECWLYRIARFVDAYNLLGLFRRRIPNAPRPDIDASTM